MKARTELLLYRLSWHLDKMMRPTWHNLHSSFESWAYGGGFLRQIRDLEARAFIESKTDPRTGRRVMRLTAKGLALGGATRNPESRWQRPWDDVWHLVIFDLPETDRCMRASLRRWLAAHGFGCVQRSVWVSPDSLTAITARLRSLPSDANGLLLLESSLAGGESPAGMVRAAWKFPAINLAWRQLADHLNAAPDPKALPQPDLARRWADHERKLTSRVLAIDPLLPEALLPDGYRGRAVWAQRKSVFAALDQAVSLSTR
jgi:phenylacetic acid degradation operon negative regulatory protein